MKLKAEDVVMEREDLRRGRDVRREDYKEVTQELEKLAEAHTKLWCKYQDLQQ